MGGPGVTPGLSPRVILYSRISTLENEVLSFCSVGASSVFLVRVQALTNLADRNLKCLLSISSYYLSPFENDLLITFLYLAGKF